MCVKQSQFYCVKLHEQPFRARACLRVQNVRFTGWSPLMRRGGRGRGGAPSLRVKKGTGDDFRRVKGSEDLILKN